jgi:plasmid stabilization system protein ParE
MRSTTFRLSDETRADLTAIARMLGLRSRSEALRYVVRSTRHNITPAVDLLPKPKRRKL